MKSAILFIIAGVFILWNSPVHAQIEEGNYVGTLHLTPRTIGLDSIGIELHVLKTSDTLYEWKMRYSNSMEKNYRLIVRNGRYLLDEQNGILLPGTLEDQKLSFHYDVDSVLYEVVYDFSVAGTIDFDLRYFRREEPIPIGKNTVQGYILSGRQYARLKKHP